MSQANLRGTANSMNSVLDTQAMHKHSLRKVCSDTTQIGIIPGIFTHHLSTYAGLMQTCLARTDVLLMLKNDILDCNAELPRIALTGFEIRVARIGALAVRIQTFIYQTMRTTGSERCLYSCT